MSDRDDDILEGVPVREADEDEEPTRTLDTPRRRQVPPPPPRAVTQDEMLVPTNRAVPAYHPRRTVQGRGDLPSFGSLVESEEALRVFDEMSHPDGTMSTFSGGRQDESRIQTLPPYTPGIAQSEAGTVELTAQELLDGAIEEPPPPPPTEPVLADEVDQATFRDAWMVFEHCPCPLFRLDGSGRIQLGNTALGQFLGIPLDDILGMKLHKTRLGRIYPDLEEDLDGCLATKSGLQRLVSYQAAANQTIRFLLWVTPFPRSAGRSNAFAGIILPYPNEK